MRSLLLVATLVLAGCATPSADPIGSASTGTASLLVERTERAEGDWTLSTPEASFVGSGNPAFDAPRRFGSANATLTWAAEGPAQEWTFAIVRDGETLLEERLASSPHAFEFAADDERIAGGGALFLRAETVAARVTFAFEATFLVPDDA